MFIKAILVTKQNKTKQKIFTYLQEFIFSLQDGFIMYDIFISLSFK